MITTASLPHGRWFRDLAHDRSCHVNRGLRFGAPPAHVCFWKSRWLSKKNAGGVVSFRSSVENAKTRSKARDVILSTEASPMDYDVPTKDVKESVKFGSIKTKQGRAIIVTECLPDSVAFKLGIAPGMRLVGISDPMRDLVWELTEVASLRYVRDTVKMRHSESIRLVLAPFVDASGLLSRNGSTDGESFETNALGSSDREEMVGVDVPSTDARDGEKERSGRNNEHATVSLSSVGGQEDSLTIREALERRYETGSPAIGRMERRMAQRRSYMERASERNDAPFFSVMALTFFVPPFAILMYAYFSGYLDALLYNWQVSY